MLDQTPSCVVAALWVFDGVDGTGNEMCFMGSSIVYLERFPRPSLCTPTTCWKRSWKQAVRSYWPGYESGYFGWYPGGSLPSERFDAYGPLTNAGPDARDAISLVII